MDYGIETRCCHGKEYLLGNLSFVRGYLREHLSRIRLVMGELKLL